MTVFVGMAIVTSLVGLWQQVVGESYLHELGYEYGDTIRFTSGFTMRSFSTFNLPFPFGFYLMLAILLALPMSLAEPRRLRSKIFFVSLPVILLALLYTFVRGAFLGLAVGLLYLAFHRYKYLVYGIPLVLVAALFIPSGAALTSAVFSSSSLQERTLSWGDRLDLFAENPFGTGIGTTGAAAEKAAKLNFQNPDLTYVPDNTWLKEMFELGILGLWLLVLMVVAMFVEHPRDRAKIRRHRSRLPERRGRAAPRGRDGVVRRDLPRARPDGPAVLGDDRDRGDDGAARRRPRPPCTGRAVADGSHAAVTRRDALSRTARSRRVAAPTFRRAARAGRRTRTVTNPRGSRP